LQRPIWDLPCDNHEDDGDGDAALPLTSGEQAILAELLHKVACARANRAAAEEAEREAAGQVDTQKLSRA
jgi:hypothetical protein